MTSPLKLSIGTVSENPTSQPYFSDWPYATPVLTHDVPFSRLSVFGEPSPVKRIVGPLVGVGGKGLERIASDLSKTTGHDVCLLNEKNGDMLILTNHIPDVKFAKSVVKKLGTVIEDIIIQKKIKITQAMCTKVQELVAIGTSGDGGVQEPVQELVAIGTSGDGGVQAREAGVKSGVGGAAAQARFAGVDAIEFGSITSEFMREHVIEPELEAKRLIAQRTKRAARNAQTGVRQRTLRMAHKTGGTGINGINPVVGY
jgi:hypothetical protein